MPKKRIKRVQTLWSIKYSECNSELFSINKEKQNLVPYITMIMRKETNALSVEYMKYLSHKYPLVKRSSDEWIDSFAIQWKALRMKEDAYKLMLDRLNGIPDADKDKWNGKNPSLEETC